LDLDIVEDCDRSEGVVEVTSSSTVVAKYPPVLEARERVFDASPALATSTPCAITYDPVVREHGSDQFGYPAVSAICEYACMRLAHRFER
jgi:hypothetical protein